MGGIIYINDDKTFADQRAHLFSSMHTFRASVYLLYPGAPLLTWINFNPSMDK